jgi:S1-C subfamily serine protease
LEVLLLTSRPIVKRRLTVVVIVMMAALGATSACSSGSDTATPKASATTRPTTGQTTGAQALQDAYVKVVAQVRPSVVEISTDTGLGSGVVYDAKGHIVTNNHVVGGATRFRVTLADGRTIGATLVGAYPPDDLAIIQLSGANLPQPAPFADSSRVQVGQIALAIGNPLGLASSVTDGIVSFNGRTVAAGPGVVLPSTIQTSAPINPGNSGGALVDLEGAVIGIPTLAATDPQLGGGAAPGIGFAIPSNTVKRIADQLVRTGKVTDSGRAALGIAGTDVVGSSDEQIGVLVRGVRPGSAAAKAGIAPGDVITSVDGTRTPDLVTLTELLAAHKPGDRVRVEILHPDGTRDSKDVTLDPLSQ